MRAYHRTVSQHHERFTNLSGPPHKNVARKAARLVYVKDGR